MYQDREEWSRARNTGKHAEVSLREYTGLLQFVSGAARVYDMNVEKSLGVKFFDKGVVEEQGIIIPIEEVPPEEINLESLVGDVAAFDNMITSDEAFESLERELGL